MRREGESAAALGHERHDEEEENSFSESDDARFRHPSNDRKKKKKKKKNWCRHQTQENERGSESVIRCYCRRRRCLRLEELVC